MRWVHELRSARLAKPTLPLRPRDERGVAAVFVMLLAVALLAMAGLVIDGGYAMAGNRRLSQQAQQAARVGADTLDQNSLRDGGIVTVQRPQAIAAAQAYLARIGAPRGSISVEGGTVTVRLSGRTKTAIMSAVGVSSLPIGGHASARSIDEDGP